MKKYMAEDSLTDKGYMFRRMPEKHREADFT
jgi:hypothetical protein